jgi:hypothetical protein
VAVFPVGVDLESRCGYLLCVMRNMGRDCGRVKAGAPGVCPRFPTIRHPDRRDLARRGHEELARRGQHERHRHAADVDGFFHLPPEVLGFVVAGSVFITAGTGFPVASPSGVFLRASSTAASTTTRSISCYTGVTDPAL